MEIPTKTLPKVLGNMIQHMVNAHDVNGWNIYENKSGHICLNIRFDPSAIIAQPIHVSTCSTNQDKSNKQLQVSAPMNGVPEQLCDIHTGVQYRRVSVRQQNRNSLRVQAYKDSKIGASASNSESEIESARNFNECDMDCSLKMDGTPADLSMDHCGPDLLPLSPLITCSLSGTPRTVLNASADPVSDQSVVSPIVSIAKSYEMVDDIDGHDTTHKSISVEHASSQTNPSSTSNRMVQCEGVRLKHKYSQSNPIKSHTLNTAVQVTPETMDYASQKSVSLATKSQQMGTFLPLVSSSSQAGTGINRTDFSVQVTLNKDNYNDKISQTTFLCPGYEDDPSYDTFVSKAACDISACRYYNGQHARSLRTTMYKCEHCNIIMCLRCKKQSVHDELCEKLLEIHRS